MVHHERAARALERLGILCYDVAKPMKECGCQETVFTNSLVGTKTGGRPHFRRILEESALGKAMFEAINRVLEENGHFMRGGTIVDATIISAPPSVKNADKKRDEEMSSTRKGSDWHFGMKAHVGVDAGTA